MLVHAYPARSNVAENPFNAILSDALERNGCRVVEPSKSQGLFTRADVVLVNWPQAPVHQKWVVGIRRSLVQLLRLAAQRARGAKCVWIVHNAVSHDGRRPRLERLYMRLVVGLLSGAVFLTAESREKAIAEVAGLGALPFTVMPHPVYGEHYPPSPGKIAARRHFNLPTNRRIVGIVGDLKAYKGADDFLRAFSENFEIDGFLAGKAREPKLIAQVQHAAACAAKQSRTLTHVDRRVSDLELVTALAALDLLVLPYKDSENSGVAILAAERGTPILARANPAIEELSGLLGASTIQAFTGELEGASMCAAASKAQPATDDALAAFKERHSAEKAAQILKRFFESISGFKKVH